MLAADPPGLSSPGKEVQMAPIGFYANERDFRRIHGSGRDRCGRSGADAGRYHVPPASQAPAAPSDATQQDTVTLSGKGHDSKPAGSAEFRDHRGFHVVGSRIHVSAERFGEWREYGRHCEPHQCDRRARRPNDGGAGAAAGGNSDASIRECDGSSRRCGDTSTCDSRESCKRSDYRGKQRGSRRCERHRAARNNSTA